jgi:hypothetical protein
LALVRGADAGQLIPAVAFGSPPGIIWQPGTTPLAIEATDKGFAVAHARPGSIGPALQNSTATAGRVQAICLANSAGSALQTVPEAVAVAGRGLEGDRYFNGQGTFSDRYSRGHDLTLIEQEVLDDLSMTPETTRRNIITSGVELDTLIGAEFRIREVSCLGQRRCEPCAHLARLTAPGTLRALVHQGGLRADILRGGVIRVGDELAAAERAAVNETT